MLYQKLEAALGKLRELQACVLDVHLRSWEMAQKQDMEAALLKQQLQPIQNWTGFSMNAA